MPRSSGHWLIYVLTIEGSYQQNIERPASGAPDSMQYWISGLEAWDIRTFAIDKDLRIQQLDVSQLKQEPLQYFDDVARRTYGDILGSVHKFEVAAEDTDETLKQKVEAAGLFSHAYWTTLDFPLWLPENLEYASRSD